MKLAQDRSVWLWRALGLLGVAAIAGVLVWATEWVEERRPVPLPPELARDGSFIARQYLGSLGLRVHDAQDLGRLPPPGATLLLSTSYWPLFNDITPQLKRWVEDGGHLVIDGDVLASVRGNEGWLPLRSIWPRAPTENDQGSEHDAPDPDSDEETTEGTVPGRTTHSCRVLKQREGLAPALGDARGFVSCARSFSIVHSDLPATWALHSDEVGTEVLRVALGRGRITAMVSSFHFQNQNLPSYPQGQRELHNFSNRGLLTGDHAALLAALVDAQPGGEVWFVTRLQRPPFLVWLWQLAAPALLLGFVALVLALWRGGARFGPLLADAAPARRAFSAQIRGSAEFLFRQQPATLHAASLRALDETAARQLAGWRQMAPSRRLAALAAATGLPEARLQLALDTAATPRNAAAWSEALALLETARRALRDGAAHPHAARAERPA